MEEARQRAQEPPHAGGRRRGRMIVTLSLCSTAAMFWCLLYRDFIVDDAFITLRYARNLARFGAPVWNPGEDPCEGYTSPLHMLVPFIVTPFAYNDR